MMRRSHVILLGLVASALAGGTACGKKERNFDRILNNEDETAGASGAGEVAGRSGNEHAGTAGTSGHSNSGASGTDGEGTAGGSVAASGNAGDGSSTGGTATGGAATGGTATGGTGTGGTGGSPEGGAAGSAGTVDQGGTAGQGGSAGSTGAFCLATDTSEVICNDSLDDDCDGLVDCDDILDCSAAANCCVPSGATEMLCDNATDDDCDGARDCDDSDCAANVTCAPTCTPTAATETACSGGEDEDCDGLTDCDDADDCFDKAECQPACVPSGATETACEDTLDDDCDGFLNCADSDCAADTVCQTACIPEDEDCTNSVDDDCDGFADCLDSQCASTAACCTGDAAAAEDCGDGVDNNCDGVIDCPVIVSAFPALPPQPRANWEGGAASGTDVFVQLEAPARPAFVVQCRTGKPNTIATSNFHVCNPADPTSLDLTPIESSYAIDPANNGVAVTQIRLAYPNGSVSRITEHTTYIHNSLVGANLCPARATPTAYFDAARPRLVSASSAKFSNAEARLRSPFVNIDFDPPLYSYFDVAAGSGPREILSLRRLFVLDENKDMVLMTRIYASLRAESRRCLAAMIRKRDTDPGLDANKDESRHFDNGCDAVVLNKDGAGVCLVVDSSNVVTVAYEPAPGWRRWSEYWSVYVNSVSIGWPTADIFMWRKLVPTGSTPTARRLFSPKCYQGGESCTGGDPSVLYLPDRDLFDW